MDYDWIAAQFWWIQKVLALLGAIFLIDAIQRHSRRMHGIRTEEETAAYYRGVNHALYLVNKLDLPVKVWIESEEPLTLGSGKVIE